MADTIDPRLVRRLAGILRETDLTEIEVEQGELRIRVARETGQAMAQGVSAATPVYAAAPQPMQAAPTASSASSASPATAPAAPAAVNGDEVKSPMVGTVYLSPAPGADPFVQPGQKVTAGQTLLIIEAMKTMNPIPAPRAGTLVELLVANEQPVEFGEALAIIE